MNISAHDFNLPRAVAIAMSDTELKVDLSDGRSLSVPLSWYPRLSHATPRERANWKLIGNGEGVHWPEIEEDISIEGLIAGRASQESQASFGKWLAARESK